MSVVWIMSCSTWLWIGRPSCCWRSLAVSLDRCRKPWSEAHLPQAAEVVLRERRLNELMGVDVAPTAVDEAFERSASS